MTESAAGEGDRYEYSSSTLISGYVERDRHFVERPWFEEKLQEALAAPYCRFLLLTGSCLQLSGLRCLHRTCRNQYPLNISL